MGNLYNVEQKSKPEDVAAGKNQTTAGLEQWKLEVRKQVMEKLKGYAPEKVEQIINATF